MTNPRSKLLSLLALGALLPTMGLAGCPRPRHAQSNGKRLDSAALLNWSIMDFKAGHVRVIFKRSPRKQVAAVRVYFDGGTRNLTDGNAGIEELTISTMELGGSRRYPLDKMIRTLAKNGVQLYTAAGQDYSVVAVKTPKSAFPLAWNILTDLVLHPNLGGIALEVQRRRQLAAIASRFDNPDAALVLMLEKSFFAGHPYARRQMGTADNVRRFRAADLRAYYKKILNPNRMLVVITGDLDPTWIRHLANKAFGQLTAGAGPVSVMPRPAIHAPSVTHVARDLPTNYVLAYFPAPKPGQKGWAAWKLATAWLSDALFEELRTKRRLCYAVSADLSVRQANIGYIYLSSRKPARALSLTMATIHRMAARGISPKELRRIQRVQATEYLFGLQTQSAQARLLARAALTAGNVEWALRSPAEIEAVSPRAVKQALDTITKSIQVLVLGPTPVSRSVLMVR